MDITEVIAHQHAEQRRLFGILEEWDREDTEGLAALWKRLSAFLEVHAAAEERYFYPELLRLGTGGADAPDAQHEVEDAVQDHNDLREAIKRADAARTGSDEWWKAVIDANVANSTHMAEEERQDLADFRQQASLELRHRIAVEFYRYEALRPGGVAPRATDVKGYLERKDTGEPTEMAEQAAADARRASDPEKPLSDEDSLQASPETMDE
ncbi:Hemerythrin HHE cation binding domain-containing protein [Kytococcus aerolatus]|uniref:Hemerythrin HHE cation binding domain-containing protein n=1 Tax=Kytococcus aerolatus TaxID=592308 RepID=A0A212U6H0_9MICO|nr:hemerythrin domain-containing protein [Kytococcus aerolatus]SNC73853.1 Hemerythrin HHE cation binding domain-containing protein [Kytococcus aerolatus]